MKTKVLMLGPLPKAQMARLENRFDLCKLWQAEDPEAALAAVRHDVQAIVSTNYAGAKVSEKLMQALPNLEVISHHGVGYDLVDVAAARARGVAVAHTPDLLDDTADIGMGLVLAVTRRMVEADIYARTGQWEKRGTFPRAHSLRNKVLGIVGLGRIGRTVARRAAAFDIKVVYYAPRPKKDVDYPHYSNLRNMAQACDILVLTCRYDDTTHHLIDAGVLAALGERGILVNISRGAVVDQNALVTALADGVIAGAGLDVYENEPQIPLALQDMDNVVLLPHIGNHTHESVAAMAALAVDNLLAYFDKGAVLTPV